MILIHHSEELFDTYQVFFHEALFKLADHILEFLEGDLTRLVNITGTKQFSWCHIIPALKQVNKLLKCKRFKLHIAPATGTRPYEVLLTR